MKRIALSWRVPAPAVMLALLGCGADLTLPGSVTPGLAVAVLQGDGQIGTVGEELPAPVVVEVKTDGGQAMADRRVAFVAVQGAGAGGFDPDTAVTDSKGQALTRWVLGTAVGVYTAEARLVPDGDSALPTVALQATAGPGDPDTLRAISTAIQSGSRGEPLPEPLAVRAVDRYGNPVAGVEVKWEASSGNGELSAETTLTDPDGATSVIWTLGNRVGVQRATAEVDHADGSPVTFTATVGF
jgi:Bacterial Ig-like domain (group 1)